MRKVLAVALMLLLAIIALTFTVRPASTQSISANMLATVFPSPTAAVTQASPYLGPIGYPPPLPADVQIPQAAQSNPPVPPKFLTLPFDQASGALPTDNRPQQGWWYNINGNNHPPDPSNYQCEAQNYCHKGIDYMRSDTGGFTVRAAADGYAKFYHDCDSSVCWGNTVYIRHSVGGYNWFTLYAHLASWSIPNDGQEHYVSRGDSIGVAGMSGGANGIVHLHFEFSRDWIGGTNRIDPYGVYATQNYYPFPSSGQSSAWITDPPSYPGTTVCSAPSLIEPSDGAVLNNRTVTFRWNPVSGCTFNGYTFRICTSADVGYLPNCFIDTGESNTQRTELINGHDNQDLWWGVKAANNPNENWAARRFRIDLNSGIDGIQLCDGTNFGIPCDLFTAGRYSNLANYGWYDRAESVRFRGNYIGHYHVALYSEVNFSGTRLDYDSDVADLGSAFRNRTRSLEIYYIDPRPQPPALQSPDNGAIFNEGNSIALSWSATGNEYYGEVWGGPAGTSTFGWQSGTSKNIGSQWAGYTYSWHVRARNAAGESPDWSSTRTFIVKPAAPTNLSAQISSCRSITLTWQDNSGSEEGYKIFRDGALVGQVGANTTRFVDTGLVGATSYSYVVRTYRGNIPSDASSTTTVITPRCPPVNAGALPWRCDTSGSVLQDRQSAFGMPAHYGLDQWAWDFGTIGSQKEVYAARSGIVAAVETGYSDPGWCVSSCDPNAVNRIVVDHGDGTAGLYLHLAQEIPASLHVGDPVVAGVTRIGYIDSTLQYNYPHVHYAVQAWNSAWNGTGVWYKPSIESLFYDDNTPKMIADGYNPTVSHSPYPSGNCTGVMTPTLTLNMGTQVHNRPITLELYRNTSAGRLDPPLFQATARADFSGTVTFTLSSMVPNTYTLRVKPLSLLRKQMTDVNIGWATELDVQTLCSGGWFQCAGDTVSDNKINSIDLSQMYGDWNPLEPISKPALSVKCRHDPNDETDTNTIRRRCQLGTVG